MTLLNTIITSKPTALQILQRLFLFTTENLGSHSHGEDVLGGRCATRNRLKPRALKALKAQGATRQDEKAGNFCPSMLLQSV